MDILQIAQSLIPRIELIRAVKDRERNSSLGEFLSQDDLEHLEQRHQFKEIKNGIKVRQRNIARKGLFSSIKVFIRYIFSILNVIVWVLTLKKKRAGFSQGEIVLLKGLGFQHLNPHIPTDEIVESIPNQALQTKKELEPIFILISQLPVSPSTKAHAVRNSFQALLLSQKPEIKPLIHFVFHAIILGLAALVNTSIRKILGEIPSALLLANFPTKYEYLSLIDTQGSFEVLDLMYYVKNESPNFKSVMIHYSEGGMPFTVNQLSDSPFVHQYELAPVHRHIVWTEEYAQFFNSRKDEKIFLAMGPQVFRNVKITERPRNPHLTTLSVFDETPSLYDESYEHMREEAGLGFLTALENLHQNFNSSQETRLKISFKQKRRNLELHSKAYLEKLDSLCKEGALELRPWFTNPFELITGSDLVLTVLGSSPALIGRHLGYPTAYGYFGKQPLGQPLVDYGIPILTSDEELNDWITNSSPFG